MRSYGAVRANFFPASFLVAAFIISVCLIIPSFHYPISDDAFFELVGREIIHGRPLYSGIWDNKPPFIYLANALLQFCFGNRFVLHRLVEYAITLASIIVFSQIVRRPCPRFWAPATLAYAIMVSLPTTAFLNYSQQYAMLPMMIAVLFAMRQRSFASGVAHGVAIAFWQPAIFVSVAILILLREPRARIIYALTGIGFVVVAIILLIWIYSASSMSALLHDMVSYQSIRMRPNGSVGLRIRLGLFRALVLTGLVYPLLVLGALIRRLQTRDEVAAMVWLGAAFAGAVTNLNFSLHYFYPVIAPTIYTIGLLAERTSWTRTRVWLSVLAALIAIALIPRTLSLMRLTIAQERSEDSSSKRLASTVRAYVPPGGEILIYGYVPEVYLLAERRPSGRYANYLALRSDTVPRKDRIARLHEYVGNIRRSAAFIELQSDPAPPSIQQVVDKTLRPICSNAVIGATIYVLPTLVDGDKRCVGTVVAQATDEAPRRLHLSSQSLPRGPQFWITKAAVTAAENTFE